MERKILFEDNHLIAVQKLPGDLVQGDQTGDSPLGEWVKNYLKEKYNKPGNVYLGTLHRLDRPVWGLVLFAKTSKAASRMSKLFSAKEEIDKEYLCLTEEGPDKGEKSGLIQSYLLKEHKENIVQSVKGEKKGAKKSLTQYEYLGAGKRLHCWRLTPLTGRPHQLRVHMAKELGKPIAGDVKYGSHLKTNNRSLYLLAYRIRFIHPVKKEPIEIQAELPSFDLWSELAAFV